MDYSLLHIKIVHLVRLKKKQKQKTQPPLTRMSLHSLNRSGPFSDRVVSHLLMNITIIMLGFSCEILISVSVGSGPKLMIVSDNVHV